MIERDPRAAWTPTNAPVLKVGDKVLFIYGERAETKCSNCGKSLFFSSRMLQEMSGNVYEIASTDIDAMHGCTACGHLLSGRKRFAAFRYSLRREESYEWNGGTYYAFPACANELTLVEAGQE